jgi:heterodisulfide reductase subunit A-like polyferredoxin
MADISRNPNIRLLTCSQVVDLQGEAGDFHVTLEREARYVDEESCTGCGLCSDVCPVEIPSEFNAKLDKHKAIYRRFPQAIPAAFVIEKQSPCKNSCPGPVQGYSPHRSWKVQGSPGASARCGCLSGHSRRVCYHPCEEICERASWDHSVHLRL